MENKYLCRVCNQNSLSPISVSIRGAIRALIDNSYTVWKCVHCESLNALEKVDYENIYLTYPYQKQKYDFFTKKIFKKRLNNLIKAGLMASNTILDYGCGSGLFVKFLQEHSYQSAGYEPFNAPFSDPETLLKKYDFVISQDVIEHVDNPHQLLEKLRLLVNEKGKLIIGTPFSDNVNLFNRIDQIGALHQPFHRFLIAKNQIKNVFEISDWRVDKVIEGSYADTWFPFINRKFLFNLFKCLSKKNF